MKLADWARKNGLDYKTAYRLYRSGKFPIPAQQLATGTILVHETPTITPSAALYARVSSQDQKEDLERQLRRLRDYAAQNGMIVTQEVTEIGSGLNGHREKLLKLLSNPGVSTIVVEHGDRVARYGSEYVAAALEASHRELKVINLEECRDGLVQDMIDVLTSFCAGLYGRRGAEGRVKKALEAIQSEGIQD